MTAVTPFLFCRMMLSSVLFFSPHVNKTSFLALTEVMRSGLASNEEESTFTPCREREGRRESRERGREGGRGKGGTHSCHSR